MKREAAHDARASLAIGNNYQRSFRSDRQHAGLRSSRPRHSERLDCPICVRAWRSAFPALRQFDGYERTCLGNRAYGAMVNEILASQQEKVAHSHQAQEFSAGGGCTFLEFRY